MQNRSRSSQHNGILRFTSAHPKRRHFVSLAAVSGAGMKENSHHHSGILFLLYQFLPKETSLSGNIFDILHNLLAPNG